MTTMTIPQVLCRAEQVIAESGWCQRAFQDGTGAVCARGGIRMAVAGTVIYPRLTDPQLLLTRAAEDALSAHIGGCVDRWNDEPQRTEAEVRAALLAAAREAAA